MTLDPRRADAFYIALQAAGMPHVPDEFSVVPQHQIIATSILAEIANFIRAFDRVTGRVAWQAAALREAPAIAQLRRPEVCFFSAWDSSSSTRGRLPVLQRPLLQNHAQQKC